MQPIPDICEKVQRACLYNYFYLTRGSQKKVNYSDIMIVLRL